LAWEGGRRAAEKAAHCPRESKCADFTGTDSILHNALPEEEWIRLVRGKGNGLGKTMGGTTNQRTSTALDIITHHPPHRSPTLYIIDSP